MGGLIFGILRLTGLRKRRDTSAWTLLSLQVIGSLLLPYYHSDII